jgi:hypothetical protein
MHGGGEHVEQPGIEFACDASASYATTFKPLIYAAQDRVCRDHPGTIAGSEQSPYLLRSYL